MASRRSRRCRDQRWARDQHWAPGEGWAPPWRAKRVIHPARQVSTLAAATESLQSLLCFGPLPREKRGYAKHDSSHPLREGKGERDIAADTQHVTYCYQSHLLHTNPRRHDEQELPR